MTETNDSENGRDSDPLPAASALATLCADEAKFRDRRRDYFNTHCRDAPINPEDRLVGLALSGGGIRSATFSLGILQALSRHGRLPSIDYISTVSGGGYIGAFFGALFVAPEKRGGIAAAADAKSHADFLKDPLGSARGKRAIARLREFGRYLTPGGMSDVMFGASLITRNWLMLQCMLALLPLLFFLALQFVAGQVDAHDDAMGLDNSASLMLFAAAFAVWNVSLGIALAYWFTRKEQEFTGRLRRLWQVPFLGNTALALIGYWALPNSLAKWCVLLMLGSATGVFLVAQLCVGSAIDPADKQKKPGAFAARAAEDKVRAKLTRWLANFNTWAIVLFALGVLNLLGELMAERVMAWSEIRANIAQEWGNDHLLWDPVQAGIAELWPLLLAVVPIAVTIWAHRALRHGGGPGWLARPSGQTALGFSILFMWLATWSMAAVLLTRLDSCGRPYALLVTGALFAASCWLYGFLNLSSLVTLYAARLKRAYLGASNPHEDGGLDVDNPGDLIPMPEYYASAKGAPEGQGAEHLEHARPIHLINATIAQTVPKGKSKIAAFDRKGEPLHLSPAGILAGSGKDAMGLTLTDGETLALSDWTAISGAAAATAVGSQGSLGLSVLALMTNVRLGYWWRPRDSANKLISPKSLGDTMPSYLLREMLMRFGTWPDPDRRWYLTDGGHFDNTGLYALLQRELPFIIVCDNGADPDYLCSDLISLMNRARTDLGVEIEFLDENELKSALSDASDLRKAIGTLKNLCTPARKPEAGEEAKRELCATLARVTYAKGPGNVQREGRLLLIKPRLDYAVPPDLQSYRSSETGRAFPQQTTLDQAFDEVQWEAYRRLGEDVGERLFADNVGMGEHGWIARRLSPSGAK